MLGSGFQSLAFLIERKSIRWVVKVRLGFPGSSAVKNLPAKAGDVGLIPGLGRFSGEGNGNLFQYSCLENPVDRGAWQAIVHGVTKSWTRLE